MSKDCQEQLIDPDPFTLASIALSVSSVILSFVQIYKSSQNSPNSRNFSQREKVITQLEKALEDYDNHMKTILRQVNRYLQNPDKEIYESKFRISVGVMKFEINQVSEYHNNLSQLSAKLGILTTWVGNILANDQELSYILGEELNEKLGDSANRLNDMIKNGGNIGIILEESNLIRGALKSALSKMLDNPGNY